MIQAEFYINKQTGDELQPAEYDYLVQKYGQAKADEMVQTLVYPPLKQEEPCATL